MVGSLRDLFLLDPGVAFLNHGSFGACPRPVFEAYQVWQRELERQPVAFMKRRLPGLMREARQALAAFVGAAPEDLVYVPNATTGVNIVARSLPLSPGDEVLATDHEYGAVDRAWRFVCARRGARYVRQPVLLPVQAPEQMVEAVWSGVTARTRVLCISHITSPTAVVFPVAALVRRARDAGILTLVDGAHAPGQVDLDLPALGADFYVGNCHKWLMAPKGAGFLYARREAQALLQPLVVSWGWDSPHPGPSRFVDEQEYQGTRDISAYLAVSAAIRFYREREWAGVRRSCHRMLSQARLAITDLTGLAPLTPDGPGWYVQMVALPLPPCDGPALQLALYDQHRVEVPVIRWNGGDLLRISVQGYNTEHDLVRLLDALAALLPQGVASGLKPHALSLAPPASGTRS